GVDVEYCPDSRGPHRRTRVLPPVRQDRLTPPRGHHSVRSALPVPSRPGYRAWAAIREPICGPTSGGTDGGRLPDGARESRVRGSAHDRHGHDVLLPPRDE